MTLIMAALTLTAAAATPALVPGGRADWTSCTGCHEEVGASFVHNVHGRIRAFETRDGSTGCATCHGDATAHLESGETTGLRLFGRDPEADTAACLTCHSAHGASEWSASAHATELGCSSCHSVHTRRAPGSTCATCHADVQALMRAPSHHPVVEGKMSCALCHDVHAANPGALKTAERTNELCTSCHPSQEGPFVFEHAPVAEDCLSCHQPHGSTANNLLAANEPFLCLQCHELHFHTGFKAEEGGTRVIGGQSYPNVMGADGNQRAFGTRCTQCHIAVHGSDLPSQTVTGRGNGLAR